MKNLVARRYLIFSVVVILICMICMLGFNIYQDVEYKNSLNQYAYTMVEMVKEKYPEVSEEEIVDLINADNIEGSNDVLADYGISDDVYVFGKMEHTRIVTVVGNLAILTGLGALLLVVFCIYTSKRKKKIDELDRYIQDVSNKMYEIGIDKESEDELNRLKDSLYKITVMLKEDSESKRKQNEAILELVSDISHQLKTPITSIQILLDNILENDDMDSDTRRKFTLEILRQVKGMNFLIFSLLKLSKLDACVVEFDNEKINVNAMIADVLADLDVLVELKCLDVHVDISDEISFDGDYSWNKEAVLNIVKNAVEYSAEGKNIFISAEENDLYTKIVIRDEGKGIDEKDLPHVFERFYKRNNSAEDSFGIGLALSKSIVEKQDGFISVDSKVGVGTVFTIKYFRR